MKIKKELVDGKKKIIITIKTSRESKLEEVVDCITRNEFERVENVEEDLYEN